MSERAPLHRPIRHPQHRKSLREPQAITPRASDGRSSMITGLQPALGHWADGAARRRVSQAPATAARRMPFARCQLLSTRCRSALSVGAAPANRDRLTVRTRYAVTPTAAIVLAAAAAIMGLSPPERQLLFRAAVVATRVS